jgi:hypothetical protein
MLRLVMTSVTAVSAVMMSLGHITVLRIEWLVSVYRLIRLIVPISRVPSST